MPVRDSRLKSPAFVAKTGGATRSFQRTRESRPGLGLQPSARPRPARYDRTSRNNTRYATRRGTAFPLIDHAAHFHAGSQMPLLSSEQQPNINCDAHAVEPRGTYPPPTPYEKNYLHASSRCMNGPTPLCANGQLSTHTIVAIRTTDECSHSSRDLW